MNHPCELYDKTLVCKSRHLNAALDAFGVAIKKAADKMSANINAAWKPFTKRLRGL